jgi:hypothetical protein
MSKFEYAKLADIVAAAIASSSLATVRRRSAALPMRKIATSTAQPGLYRTVAPWPRHLGEAHFASQPSQVRFIENSSNSSAT